MQKTIATQDHTTVRGHCVSVSDILSSSPRLSKQPTKSHFLPYHLHTLLLFTYDQFFDTIIPGTIFGLLTTLAGPELALASQPLLNVFLRGPILSAWLWLIILQFCLQNQCSEGSPEEDAINKPWRPIPSQRITLADAKNLLKATHLVAGLMSWYLGVVYPFIIWTALSTLYNDLGGSDRSGFVRNLFCGGFFTCSFGGALMLALGEAEMSKEAMQWTLLVCWCILLTTIQTQEFRDEVGDKVRGRRTLVTELGRTRALWTVYVAVTFWSLYIPFGFFKNSWKLAIFPVSIGGKLIATAIRAMARDGQKVDRKMYKLWCLWMVAFFPLPLLKRVFG